MLNIKNITSIFGSLANPIAPTKKHDKEKIEHMESPIFSDEDIYILCHKMITTRFAALTSQSTSNQTKADYFRWFFEETNEENVEPFSFVGNCRVIEAAMAQGDYDPEQGMLYDFAEPKTLQDLLFRKLKQQGVAELLIAIHKEYPPQKVQEEPQMGLFFDQDGMNEKEVFRRRREKNHKAHTINSSQLSLLEV